MITFYIHWGPLNRYTPARFEVQWVDRYSWFFGLKFSRYYQTYQFTIGPIEFMLQTAAGS